MPLAQEGWTPCRLQFLMDITGVLADFTRRPELCREIPEYLSRMFQTGPFTLAVIQETNDAAEIVLRATSSDFADAESAAFEGYLLSLHAQTRPLTAQQTPALRPQEIETPDQSCPAEAAGIAACPRVTVFAHMIGERHRMLLIAHQRVSSPHLPSRLVEILELVAQQLSKYLGCMVAWMGRPESLGDPFNRLTAREWVVLRGLNSAAGEKQLADELGLSPHTLHSHIKSIYRKVGVQGRLPLIMRAEEAIQDLRLRKLALPKHLANPAANPTNSAVAVG